MSQQFWHVTKFASNGKVLAEFITPYYTPRALQDWCNDQPGRKAVAFLDENHVDTFEYIEPSWTVNEFEG